MYCCYAIGCPVIITIVTIIMSLQPQDKGFILPNFGVRDCFFGSKYASRLTSSLRGTDDRSQAKLK